MPRRAHAYRRTVHHKGQRKLNYRQKIQVKRLIGKRIESKRADTTLVSTSITSASFFSLANMPAQGDAYNERSGDEILIEKFQWRLNIVAADPTNVVRVIVFRWNLNNATTTPTLADILEGANATDYLEYQGGVENKYNILSDRTYALSTAGVPSRIVQGTCYGKKLGRKKIGFNQGLITGMGQIYIMFMSDSAIAAHPTVAGSYSLVYSDG